MRTVYPWIGHWGYSMEKYNNLGQVFKNLRTNGHISLKQILNERVSAAQVSRFERETDLYRRTIYLFISGQQQYKQGSRQAEIEDMKKSSRFSSGRAVKTLRVIIKKILRVL